MEYRSLSELAKSVAKELELEGVKVTQIDSYWRAEKLGESVKRVLGNSKNNIYHDTTDDNFEVLGFDKVPESDELKLPLKLDAVCYNLSRKNMGTNFFFLEYEDGKLLYHGDLPMYSSHRPKIMKVMEKFGVPLRREPNGFEGP